MLYEVQWGDVTDRVEAENENDAWSAFCATHPDALKHPNKFPRVITPLQQEEMTPSVELPVGEPAAPIVEVKTS